MRAIPLNFQTLYADLLQSAEPHAERGSISRRTVKGRAYLYVTSKDGARRNQRSLGPADDPDVVAHAARIRTVAMRDAARRTTVSALKRARIPSPILALGRVIEVVAHDGLFERGGVLIGLQEQFDTLRVVGRDDGQPSEFAHRNVVLLREAEHVRIEPQGLFLVVHKDARDYDFHSEPAFPPCFRHRFAMASNGLVSRSWYL